MRHDVFSYRLLSQLVIQESQTFGCIVKFPFCLLKQNICLILYPIKKLSPISQYVLYYYYYDKICAASTHSVRLTGSLAASWQRCTRLSKVDLRTMCSAGISFCSTRSAGSCWRSWKKNKDATTKVLTGPCCYWVFENVTHKPAHWAPAGLQGGLGHDRGAEVPPRGIPLQGLWWGLVECSCQGPAYTTQHVRHIQSVRGSL